MAVERGVGFGPPRLRPYEVTPREIELFLDCARCFYLDRRFGIRRPEGPGSGETSPFAPMLERELDVHRAEGTPHPLMAQYGIDAVPLAHELIGPWRAAGGGVQHLHRPTGLLVRSRVDDVWVLADSYAFVVIVYTYILLTATPWDVRRSIPHRRRMELAQWLLRLDGQQVSDVGHLVFCEGERDRMAFDGLLEFAIKIVACQGDPLWVEEVLRDIMACLTSMAPPQESPECPWCAYAAGLSGREWGAAGGLSP